MKSRATSVNEQNSASPRREKVRRRQPTRSSQLQRHDEDDQQRTKDVSLVHSSCHITILPDHRPKNVTNPQIGPTSKTPRLGRPSTSFAILAHMTSIAGPDRTLSSSMSGWQASDYTSPRSPKVEMRMFIGPAPQRTASSLRGGSASSAPGLRLLTQLR